MGDTWGEQIKLSIFGESHGQAIGIVIDGLPPGFKIDMDAVDRDMQRRAPGRGQLQTPRLESDKVNILSGFYEGKTTGSALCCVIENKNTRSGDYNSLLRPGHADWTALLRYGGYADMRGGGHFSGRLTAPLVFAGAIGKQLLAAEGIEIYARIREVGGFADATIPSKEDFIDCRDKTLPVCDVDVSEEMRQCILRGKQQGDSVGGVIESAAFGVPGGWGNPFFGGVETVLSSLFFSIPAVKAVEFGDGFDLCRMMGSEANDQLYIDEHGQISAKSNHNGGVLGGITSGLPIVARIAIKPTPSISKPQQSVLPETMEERELVISGRHDPCIVPRAVPVAEAVMALGLLNCKRVTENEK